MTSKARKQTYRKEYTEKWPCIVPSKKDSHSVTCSICGTDFSIAHGGASDIQLHIGRIRHRNAAAAREGTASIATMFKQQADNSVIRAETLMTNFLIEHNIALSTADHLTDLLKVMFPDSKIALKFASKRTKSTSIARTLGQAAKENIIEKIKKVPFSLSTDGSSDRGADEQLYPIVVRYFDAEVQRVVSVLLQIATTKERSTGQNIYLLLDSVLKENGILWNKVVCFTADNAAVMMGAVSGTAAFVRKANADVFINGCLCHRLHLTAEKGAQQLSFCPEELLVATYYYLEKSSKRHKDFKQVQAMCSVKDHAILKHICTRWLSMERSLGRLLEQWIPLQEYFKQEAQAGQKRKGDASDGPSESKRQKMKTTSSAAKIPVQKKSSSSASSVSASKAQATKTSEKSVSSTSRAKVAKTSLEKVVCSTSSSIKPTTTSAAKSVSSAATTKILSTNFLPSNSSKTATFKTAKRSLKRTTCISSTRGIPFSGQIFSGTKSSISDVGKVCSKVKVGEDTSRVSVTSVTKAGEIYNKFTDKNKLYCLFLQHTIPLYNVLNLELQQDEPKIHLLHDKLHKLLHDILVRFVNPKVIASACALEQCSYQELCNQRADDQLIVGHSVRDLLASGKVAMKDQEEFFKSVRRYFVSVCDYIIKSFPLKDEVLMNACVADVTKRLDTKFSSVAFFVKRFHYMEESIDQMEIEFGLYQVDSLESVSLDQRVDDVWVAISNIEDRTTGKKKYTHLPKIMLSILSLPHSNAEDERLFSLVRKNATYFRPNLSTPVLSDLLTQKVSSQARNLVCHMMTFDDKLLHKCKQAATTYNKE